MPGVYSVKQSGATVRTQEESSHVIALAAEPKTTER